MLFAGRALTRQLWITCTFDLIGGLQLGSRNLTLPASLLNRRGTELVFFFLLHCGGNLRNVRLIEKRSGKKKQCLRFWFPPLQNLCVEENQLVWVSQCSQATEPHTHNLRYTCRTHARAHTEICQAFQKKDRKTDRLNWEKEGEKKARLAQTQQKLTASDTLSSAVQVY